MQILSAGSDMATFPDGKRWQQVADGPACGQRGPKVSPGSKVLARASRAIGVTVASEIQAMEGQAHRVQTPGRSGDCYSQEGTGRRSPREFKEKQMARRKTYGFGSLLLDVILTLLTGGLWLIVILIKFMRSNSR